MFIENPLRDTLQSLTGVDPSDTSSWKGVIPSSHTPPDLSAIAKAADLGDDDHLNLSDWCSFHAQPRWATGSGLLEAAEWIISTAVENANITVNEPTTTGRECGGSSRN